MLKKLMLIVSLIIPSASFAAEGNFNFEFSPVGILIGAANGSLGIKVNENFLVGPEFLYWNVHILDVDVKASSFGGFARYYFDGNFKDGWYVGGSIASGSLEVSADDEITDETLSAKASGTFYNFGGGYHWFWDSFNINLGLMLGGSSIGEVEIKDQNGNVEETYDASGGLSGGLVFNLGFVF